MLVRGTVQATRQPHGLEQRLVNLAELERCIDQIPRTDALVYGLYMVTDRSYAFVAVEANQYVFDLPEVWSAPGGRFTEKMVRTAVKRARRVLRAALVENSLLARSVPVLLRSGEQAEVEALEPLPRDAVVAADPARWNGLLQEIAARNGQPYLATAAVTRLSLGSTKQHGTVYREVPL